MFKISKIVTVLLASMLTACSYLKYSSIQAEYTKIQNANPSQVNLKHMIDQEMFFIWGKPIADSRDFSGMPMAIVAYSSKFQANERVDTMFFKGTGTHYGLNLPEGDYTLLIYADLDQDKVFRPSEVVGMKRLVLDTLRFPEKIVKDVNIEIAGSLDISWAETIAMPSVIDAEESIFYPAGTIRRLDDPIFNDEIATMGMYDPASFLELAPTMFYALEENVAHKIPVIFVHGIGGNVRSFKKIIESMDKNRYQALFFYYPSGGDLDQLAELFYDVYLSGDVMPIGDMPMIVVAHSMGGLIVREAFNQYEGNTKENKVDLFVSIASPFGGHPSAASGERHGLIVLPSWIDLNPSSLFIKRLYRKPLPKSANHQLYYAYNNTSLLKLGENSDGVVPLSSQLHAEAQRQSNDQFGFNRSHTDILDSDEMIDQLLNSMAEVENIFPESHIKLLTNGGFDLSLSDDYSALTQHLIRYAGKYLVLMVKEKIEAINPEQERYIHAVQGKISATRDVEIEFIQFMKEYPDLVESALEENTSRPLQ